MKKISLALVLSAFLLASCGETENGETTGGHSSISLRSTDIPQGEERSGQVIVKKINDEAVFGGVNCDVEVEPAPGAKIKRVWATVELTYNLNGRTDKYNEEKELQKVKKQNFDWVFSELRGGKAFVQSHAKVGSETVHSKKFPFEVVATQPSNEKIRQYLDNMDLAIVIFKRSAFKKFDNAGQPLYRNGFGFMNASDLSAQEIWSWKKDADKAKLDMARRIGETKNIPAKLRATNPEEYRSLPDFTPEQVATEVFQSYGTGTYYKAVKKGLPKRWQWEPSGENDGTGKQLAEVKRNIQNGRLPEGW